MRNIARLSEIDRQELFRNTADKMGLNDAIVEKDFWVCFTLDYLFHRCPWKDAITFKGGTSLSKAFNLISRFSEDIDLILDKIPPIRPTNFTAFICRITRNLSLKKLELSNAKKRSADAIISLSEILQ